MGTEISPEAWDEYPGDGDGETIPNKERGCGYLKAGNAYVRCDPAAFSTEGTLPGFVVMVDDEGNLDPIPYKESLPRGYESVAGTNFMAAAETIRNFQPLYPGGPDADESHAEAHQQALENLVEYGPYESVDEIPASELARHLDRMAIDGVEGNHWGVMKPANSKDLMMRAGKSYYPEPWDFIDEVLELGLNKGISVHDNKAPPVIQPGRTRCWIIHPHACGEDMPGVVGFSYLTRTIFTRDKDGEVPSYAEDYSDAGKMDVVDIGEPEPRDDDEGREGEDVAEAHRGLDEFPDAFEDESDGRDQGLDHTGRLSEAPETVESSTSTTEGLEEALGELTESNEVEVDHVTTRGEVIPPDVVQDIQKADLGALAGEGWLNAQEPPADHDVLVDGNVMGIIDQGGLRKVMASNNFSFDSDDQQGSSVLGPYTVEIRIEEGTRQIQVQQ